MTIFKNKQLTDEVCSTQLKMVINPRKQQTQLFLLIHQIWSFIVNEL